MAIIWALTDHRPGTANQVLGCAARTGFSMIEKRLDYNKLAQLPNAVQMFGLFGLKRSSRAYIHTPWPDAVIAAGRRSAPISVYIKRKNPATKIIHLMNPELPYKYFDMLLLPRHDNPPGDGNIIATFGAPHALTDEILFQARARLPLNPDILPKPWTLLCLGGNTAHGTFKLSDSDRMVQALAPIMQDGGSLLLTSSRRTPAALLRATTDKIRKSYPQIAISIYSPDQGGENPYHAWLAQAHRIVITADSISMISEAAFTGKPLYLYAPHQALSDKHRNFLKEMVNADYARNLIDYHPLWTGGLRLDEAGRIARDIITLVTSQHD